ncbi:MAG: 5-oxoprolinase subunit PxpB [Spirochaetales bacterium]|nr:5-oxoprolinase subunit PxpB [Spirochaetales bacterium]
MGFSYEKYFVGDSCLCWSFGDVIDTELNTMVLSLYNNLKVSDICSELKILDIVPSYKSISVYFDILESDIKMIDSAISGFFDKYLEGYDASEGLQGARVLEFPVVYDGEDLERVAKQNNLSVDDVIKIHSGGEYQVALVGFKPYFPYLIGLDERLVTPRLDNPRVAIPAGSVAIGGAQTGIYPEVSPGGWNLVGRTNPELLKAVKPGDILKFKECKDL